MMSGGFLAGQKRLIESISAFHALAAGQRILSPSALPTAVLSVHSIQGATKVFSKAGECNQDDGFCGEVASTTKNSNLKVYQRAIEILCAVAHGYFQDQSRGGLSGGTAFSVAVRVGNKVLLGNVGHAQAVVTQLGHRSVLVGATADHSPGVDDKIDQIIVRPAQDCRLDPRDFKRKDGTGFDYLSLSVEPYKMNGAAISLRSLVPDEVGDYSCVVASLAKMTPEDRKELLTQLCCRKLPRPDSFPFSNAYYEMFALVGTRVFSMTRLLGTYPFLVSQPDFLELVLPPGDCLIAAMTNGVMQVFKGMHNAATDHRPALTDRLSDMLKTCRRENYAYHLCTAAAGRWAMGPDRLMDDITASVLSVRVTSSEEVGKVQLVFVADGTGLHGQICSHLIKELMHILLVPCVEFLSQAGELCYEDFFAVHFGHLERVWEDAIGAVWIKSALKNALAHPVTSKEALAFSGGVTAVESAEPQKDSCCR